MNIQMQNDLKFISITLVALAGISVPADLPGGVYLAVIFAVLGAGGYAIAHYQADPTTAAADINTVLKALTQAVQDLKTTPVVQQPIDKNQLALDVLNIMSQLAIRASPTATSMPISVSAPTTAP